MANIPQTQIALFSTKESIIRKEIPVPSPGPGQVLIQNVAVASNPKDWRVPNLIPNYSAVEGNDVAGFIVKVGEGVTEYKGGERVAAFTKTVTDKSTSFEEAATLPLAVATAFIGLFKRLGVPEQPSGEQKGIIINGASSSVGAYAVQFAKRAGLFVIGVAGSSKDYAKEIGADIIVDYREHKGDALEGALVEAAKGKNVQHAYDAVSENGSTVFLSRVLAKVSPTGKGKVTFVLQVTDDELKQVPQGIELERTSAGTAYGDDQEFSARFFRQIGKWLAESPPFKPNRVKLLPGGLESVPKGLELLRTGQIHGEKLVYRIADTPGLK